MFKTSIYIFIVSFFLVSCGEDIPQDLPSLEGISVDWELIRTEETLHRLSNVEDITKKLDSIRRSHPSFYGIFFENVLPIRGSASEEFTKNLKGFLSDDRIIKLANAVEKEYGNMSEVQAEIDEAYRYFKYYFPDFKAPNVYTYISEYSHQAFLFPDEEKDGVGVGLDMFLGSDYPYTAMAKENEAFSGYLSRAFNRDHVPRKVMYGIVDDKVGFVSGDRLLDHMIHNGKKLYILDKVLPTTHDSIVMEYSADELEWVKDSELGMWSFFFDQELFYETDMMKINKYINPSPTSPGMPDGAPGRTANYIGWQIVKAYMERYPATNMQQLIQLSDAQLIMDKSRYKPKRK